MSQYEYHQLLKYLYFEGYADSYQEAEYIVEDVLGYLIDEGYTYDSESASTILMNMSEEWIHDILEYTRWQDQPLKGSGMTPQATAQARADLLKARHKFSDATARNAEGHARTSALWKKHKNQQDKVDTMNRKVEVHDGEEPTTTSDTHRHAKLVRDRFTALKSAEQASRRPRG
jgi:hypothetical protein